MAAPDTGTHNIDAYKRRAYPSTDPYEQTEEEHPDRLLEKPSSTPLMTSALGWMRTIVLLGVAVFLVVGTHRHKVVPPPTFGQYEFPPEIQIAGTHQFVLGGGAAPFGALGVYVRHSPHRLSGPATEWSVFDAHALEADLSSNEDFFNTLSTLAVSKSLLVTFNAEASTQDFITTLRTPLVYFLGDEGSDKVVSKVSAAMLDPHHNPKQALQEGAQLYMTCDRDKVHLAYGGPASHHLPRDTARPTAVLEDAGFGYSVCRALFGTFLGGSASPPREVVAPDARAGVAAGFTEQYGPSPAKKEEL